VAVPWAATVCLLYTKSDKWSHSITAPKTRIRQPIGYGRFSRAADATARQIALVSAILSSPSFEEMGMVDPLPLKK
jgi:hypothetical protein